MVHIFENDLFKILQLPMEKIKIKRTQNMFVVRFLKVRMIPQRRDDSIEIFNTIQKIRKGFC